MKNLIDLNKQVRFLEEIDKIKNVLRQSVVCGDLDHRENDAEHTWHMAMCFIVLLEYCDIKNFDLAKVLKMILIHDIVEIYAGDTPAFGDFSAKEKRQKETESAKKIFGILPENQKNEYMDLWVEFDKLESNDSKVANVFDRFQGFLLNRTSDGHTWRKFRPKYEIVLKRMLPIKLYAVELYENIVLPTIDEYHKKGIIVD